MTFQPKGSSMARITARNPLHPPSTPSRARESQTLDHNGTAGHKPGAAGVGTQRNSVQARNVSVTPAVYKPQPQPRVLQKKAAVVSPPPPSPTPTRAPTAPPIYRPQPTPRVLQPKADSHQARGVPTMGAKRQAKHPVHGSSPESKSERVGVTQPKVAPNQHDSRRALPAAPPVYRPQPTPKVLQAKANIHRPPNAGTQRSPTRPVAPAVYRPQPFPKVLQRKALGGQSQPSTPARGVVQMVQITGPGITFDTDEPRLDYSRTTPELEKMREALLRTASGSEWDATSNTWIKDRLPENHPTRKAAKDTALLVMQYLKQRQDYEKDLVEKINRVGSEQKKKQEELSKLDWLEGTAVSAEEILKKKQQIEAAIQAPVNNSQSSNINFDELLGFKSSGTTTATTEDLFGTSGTVATTSGSTDLSWDQRLVPGIPYVKNTASSLPTTPSSNVNILDDSPINKPETTDYELAGDVNTLALNPETITFIKKICSTGSAKSNSSWIPSSKTGLNNIDVQHETKPSSNISIFYRWEGNILKVYGVGNHVNNDNSQYEVTWSNGKRKLKL